MSAKFIRETLSEIWQDDISSILSPWWNKTQNQLTVFSSTPEGKIQASTMSDASIAKSFSLVDEKLGHVDIVRDVIQLNNSLVVSGGEDSKVCIWTT